MPHDHSHIDDKCYPSVTEIIHAGPKPWLDKWKVKVGIARAERKLKLSNMIGTEFHRCIELIMKGQKPNPKCPRVKGMLKSFDKWFAVTDVAPYACEMKVYSHKWKYQGTFDMVGEINGVPLIVDYKSSSQISEDMGLQLVAYAVAYEEMTGLKLTKGLIVLVKKDKPNFRLITKEFEMTDKLFAKFLQKRDEYVEFPCPLLKK